ncbi:hypothetical protein [Streptomyces sp. NBC_00079]|uniref:hypothetical protein n=1 Tax=Streptomyces sp. NBC_00079 TaxID=2975644 RepID=UPI00324EBAC2
MNAPLVRLETRRNVLLPLLPVLALLLWLSPYGLDLDAMALWPRRAGDLQAAVQGLGPLTAGAAAWMASRDVRCGTGDLLATTASPAWTRSLARWGATTALALLFYAAATAGLFALTAVQATWGRPVWWPVAVGGCTLLACSAVGYALGFACPGRFIAPLAAIGSFLVLTAGLAAAALGSPYGRLSPLRLAIGDDDGVFYPVRPDLAVVQILFLTGLAVAAVGALCLPARSGAGRRARRAAAAATAVGVLLAGCGIALAGTAHDDPRGITVPALHQAGTDGAIAFTPVCGHEPIPVCLHPAYRTLLPRTSALLEPVAAPLAGLPGIPVRIVQDTATPSADGDLADVRIQGRPPVAAIPRFLLHGATATPAFARSLRTALALALVTPPGRHAPQATPAQRALASWLVTHAGSTPDRSLLPADGATTAAAHRLAALTPTRRTAWLRHHLTDVRAGRLTLTDLP